MATTQQIALVKLFFHGNNTILSTWSDDDVATLIDTGMSAIDCAIFMVDSVLATYTTKPNIKVGAIALDWKAVIEGLNKLKLDLLLRKNQGAGDPDAPGGSNNSRRLGGAIFTGVNIPRKFNDGEFNNPPASDDNGRY